MKKYTKQLLNAASKIKLIATDIDGVMTAGEIILLENGEEIKIWNVKDRLGMHLLKEYLPDVKVAWITGRKSKQVEIRAKEQKVDFLVQECKDKIKSLINIANKMSIGMSEILYIGDDIIDLCALKKAGLSVCPKDAVVEAKKVSKYISQYDGGKGVFREVCELLLKANKKWDEILSK
ncbi:MAG: HAD hydrolase family protein [Elusimicrobia bacterium]|jgi:YrbI family 3-deoxy-D-manno-octulosonate 8-phosphate phosphatase|nr:HAD hydrolase family protein [Elusimicrobiota bacterium]